MANQQERGPKDADPRKENGRKKAGEGGQSENERGRIGRRKGAKYYRVLVSIKRGNGQLKRWKKALSGRKPERFLGKTM